MGVLKELMDPQFELTYITLWRSIQRKLRTKIRHMSASRFGRIHSVTWGNKQFIQVDSGFKFFAGFENREETLQCLKSFESEIMVQAEKILNHRFDLLGSGEVDLGKTIDWHCDFKSGYRWPRKYYHLIELEEFGSQADNKKKKDIKVPWELSRFQHLVVLGQAYWLSGDEKYTQEFKTQVISWIDENPPEIGVNWVCSMDISLRVVSMIFTYFYFHLSPVLEKSFWDRYFKLLYYSGVHIMQNPESDYRGHGNNHYLTNCAALVWLGLFFGRFNRMTQRWLKTGLANLCREMDYQVNQDGGSFEGSISYHRLTLELFLYTTIILERNGLSLPDSFKQRLEKMCEFAMDYIKPNGLAPQFGDSDNGRFCILSGYGTEDMRDHRSLLGIACEYFKRDDFRKVGAEKWLESLWLFGRRLKSYNNVQSYSKAKIVKYLNTGYYIIKDSNVFLLIKCGGIGQKNLGGHDHNDQLSFELNIGGVDFIIDPGSYVYTMDKDLRQLFRSTKFHNISQIGNLEQNTINNSTIRELFSMNSSNPGICTSFTTLGGNINFSGQIAIEGTKIQYMRTVELKPYEKVIDIVDTFMDTEQEATCRLYLAKDMLVEGVTECTVRISCGNFCARIEADKPIRLEPGMVSPCYGLKFDSIMVSWVFKRQTKFRIFYN